MISYPDTGPVYKFGRYPCGVCSKGIKRNSIHCTSCKQWVHARCSGIRGNLSKVKDFVCSSCTQQIKECDPEKVTIGNSSYDVVSQFCYLGDMLSTGGGSEASSITHTRSGWKKFCELLPPLTSRIFSLKKKGALYEACVWSVMLYGSETWPTKEEDIARLYRTDMSMLRWMSHVSLRDRKSSKELLDKFQLQPIRSVVQHGCLRWFGHIERMEDNNWVKRCRVMEGEGNRGRDRPKKMWEQVISADLCNMGVNPEITQDINVWRKAIMMNSITHVSMD